MKKSSFFAYFAKKYLVVFALPKGDIFKDVPFDIQTQKASLRLDFCLLYFTNVNLDNNIFV